ncbi:hypothetical protein EJ05DRAFT_475799 [Pseudovirgaria hyperparasitica]|uniref:Uncharacterized protein n=1 Tax=Pseudovirgaria hyperparasitica TaxID=470096 RepID=A0A6A6W7H9_9PEZI|nr:uncharacterized protein EJ05DRAFT_475799 [Pseudovirgaria hyperparasitica]KAF2758495.1 hypothetical protein EJ05DRAFT_475799 [Pseudovirgaria hyperparasitica]
MTSFMDVINAIDILPFAIASAVHFVLKLLIALDQAETVSSVFVSWFMILDISLFARHRSQY